MTVLVLMSNAPQGTSITYNNNSGSLSNVGLKSFQASITGTGAVSGIVTITVSNDNQQFVPFLTFTLSGTNGATDAQQSWSAWGYYNVTVTSLTGTGAGATVSMGQ